ncbi:hypothetical protein HF521_011762 [Silurus meridionalis]|uniref:Uncharacterized protein n=1 Tax=Silurus meridionalis TaxID=175797 RepID=A0A8T0AF77_SILME|nr:hypothetical protein HF521_011762 [Silurus meridionalis]
MIEDKARAKLMQQMDLGAYKAFNETVLAQVIFNKRREGEASHLTLDIYKKASTTSINQDIYTTLSPLGKELSKILTHLEMRGNGGKKYAVKVPHQRERKVDEDGCSDLFFSQRAPAQCSEDGVSDDEDHRQSATQAKRPSPKKKKREE